MRWALLAGALALAACGDNSKATPDGGGSGSNIDAPMTDAPPPTSNFTSYVKDLIVNQTNDTGTPKAFGEFSGLPDPDGDQNKTDAYNDLF